MEVLPTKISNLSCALAVSAVDEENGEVFYVLPTGNSLAIIQHLSNN
jgi:hypothetical protein